MNVYRRELTELRWPLLWWSLGMVMLIAASWAKYATLSEGGVQVAQMLDALPQGVQVVFGLSGFDLNTASGYFGVIFSYIALMAGIHAVLAGSDLLAKEERDRTSEFVFVKPVTRARVVSGKLLAGLTVVTVLTLVSAGTSWAMMRQYAGPDSGGAFLGWSMAGLFVIQVLFLALGALVAAVNPRPKTSSSLAASLLLATYLATVVTQINERMDFLRFLSPFSYFDAHDIVGHDSLNFAYVVLSAALVIVMVAATYRLYARRDLVV